MKKRINAEKHITVFEQKKVRRVWYGEQWFFSVSDIVQTLTDSSDVKQYIKKMRERDVELSVNWGTICTLLEITSKDGKKHKETMSNLQGIFRIIQSTPSPKAEPFKQWLAKVGQERIEEIQDPERAVLRAKRGTFEMTAKEIKEYKKLDNPDNARDHMNELELILTMLGEATTTELSRNRKSEGFSSLQKDAKDGGGIAGNTRKEIETKTGKKVMTKENYLEQRQSKKLPKK